MSFLDGRQRVLLFTEDVAVVTKARQAEDLEQFQQELKVSLQNLGLSLINNSRRQEIAYIGITRCSAHLHPHNTNTIRLPRVLTLCVCVCMLQLGRSLGDEAKESLEAFQPEEHQRAGEGLPEPPEWGEQRGLAEAGHWPGGQRSHSGRGAVGVWC